MPCMLHNQALDIDTLGCLISFTITLCHKRSFTNFLLMIRLLFQVQVYNRIMALTVFNALLQLVLFTSSSCMNKAI